MDQPTIWLAFDWQDQRIYRGIVQYAGARNWHISPYLFSDRFIPHGWPGDGAITCYGKTLGRFIQSLDMPVVDTSVADIPRTIPRVYCDNEAIGAMAASPDAATLKAEWKKAKAVVAELMKPAQ